MAYGLLIGAVLIVAAVMFLTEALWDKSIWSFLDIRYRCSHKRVRFREFYESYRVNPSRWDLTENGFALYRSGSKRDGETYVSFTSVFGYLRYRAFARRELRRQRRRDLDEARAEFLLHLNEDMRKDSDENYKRWLQAHPAVSSVDQPETILINADELVMRCDAARRVIVHSCVGDLPPGQYYVVERGTKKE